MDCIGEGKFRHAVSGFEPYIITKKSCGSPDAPQGDGPTWISFTGEVTIKEGTIPGFRAAGLSVKVCSICNRLQYNVGLIPLIQDFILFTVNPHDPKKSPFRDLRQVVPVRLTTDTWTMNGAGVGVLPAFEYSVPLSPVDTDNHGSLANGP